MTMLYDKMIKNLMVKYVGQSNRSMQQFTILPQGWWFSERWLHLVIFYWNEGQDYFLYYPWWMGCRGHC